MDGSGPPSDDGLRRLDAFTSPGELGRCLTALALSHDDCEEATVVWNLDTYTDPGSGAQGQVWLYSPTGDSQQVAFRLCEDPRTVLIVLRFVEGADVTRLIGQLEPAFRHGGDRVSILLSSIADRQWHREAYAEELHRAFHAIANLASAELDLHSIFRGLHAEIATIMAADTLSIVTCDPSKAFVRYVYHVDAHGSDMPAQGMRVPVEEVKSTPLFALIAGGDDVVAFSDEDAGVNRRWRSAGVALKYRGEVVGALCFGGIERAACFLEEDRILLAFAASHVLLALERHGWRPEEAFDGPAVRPHAARLRQRKALHPMDAAIMQIELRKALEQGQFEPYLQPIHRLDDAALVGFEALLRWNHPERGILAPKEFIDVAEDHDLIAAVDWQMFALSFRAFAAQASRTAYLSINVSAVHLACEDFSSRLCDLMSMWKLSPDRVVVELTEDVFVDQPGRVRETLLRLREAGVRAALDDFGTGYSSLHNLHALPVGILKIDRAFVEHMPLVGEGHAEAVVATILALARVLGIDVVAEGIETEAQAGRLKALGCGYGQGYLFGRPRPVCELLVGA